MKRYCICKCVIDCFHMNFGLLSVSFLSFGCHLAKSTLPIFMVFLVQQKGWSPGGYAILISTLYAASAILPMWAGYLFDVYDSRKLLITLLTMSVLGQVLFATSLHLNWFALSLLSQIVFGAAASCLVVVQRSIIAVKYFGNHAFALGCSMSAANIAKIIGRVTTAPMAVSSFSFLFSNY